MQLLIGIDIGCTRIKALALSPAGAVIDEISVPTLDEGTDRWTRQVASVYRGLRKSSKAEPQAVGIAAPGLAALDQRSIASMPGRLLGLEGLVWRDYLKLKTPAPVLNDAHAALLGEIWTGAARNSRNVMLLTLGTGVGGAAMIDGRLLRGRIGRAGHFGHISLDPDGEADVANTPGSLEQKIGECTLKTRSDGRFNSTLGLVAASDLGDPEARKVWMRSVKDLAAGVAGLINILDPEVVVIGGGIAKAGSSLFTPLRRYLRDFEWRPGGYRARVIPAQLGDRAGAFGAAWNARQASRCEKP